MAQWGRSQQVAVDGRLHPGNIEGIVPFLKPPQADSLSAGKPRFFLTLSFSGLERFFRFGVGLSVVRVAKAANRQSRIYAVLLGYGQDRFRRFSGDSK